MASFGRLRFFARQPGERLCVKPLLTCNLPISGVFAAKAADRINLDRVVPHPSKSPIGGEEEGGRP